MYRRLIFATNCLIVAIVFVTSTACDRGTPTDTDSGNQLPALHDTVMKNWSALSEEIELQPRATTTSAGYKVDTDCPLVYDFMIHWPLRSELSNETVGRLQFLRPSGDGEQSIQVHNRATGAYPVYRQTHHPGQEWWYDDIEPTPAQLDATGLLTESSWPGVWMTTRPPLGIPAFFPALPDHEIGTGSWTLYSGPPDEAGEIAVDMDVETFRYVTVDGEDAVIVDATTDSDDDVAIAGRYLISSRGRVLAAIWASPSGRDDRIAYGLLRLTGACDGISLPALPRDKDVSAEIAQSWIRFVDALNAEDREATLAHLHTSLRDDYSDEKLYSMLRELVESVGPMGLGRPVPQSIDEMPDGELRVTCVGRGDGTSQAPILTEASIRPDADGFQFTGLRATDNANPAVWNLLDLSADRRRADY